MKTKTVDGKGRITLGQDFVNQTVVIDDSNPISINERFRR